MEGKKTVWFVRHAESMFNLLARPLHTEDYHQSATECLIVPDAHLTQTGKEQCTLLRHNLSTLFQAGLPELCVVSPLTRAIQTCLYAMEGTNVPVICVANARERRESSCDFGEPVHILRRRFPNVQFHYAVGNVWWFDDGLAPLPSSFMEPDELVLYRLRAFEHWLRQRPERRIVVFSHGVFLRRLLSLSHWLHNCDVVPMDIPHEPLRASIPTTVAIRAIPAWDDSSLHPCDEAIVVLGQAFSRLAPYGLTHCCMNRLRLAAAFWRAAAEGFQHRRPPLLFLCGGTTSDGSVSEAAAMAQAAADALHIPQAMLVCEDRSLTTVENAVFLRPLLQQHGVRRIVVCTSTFHRQRAEHIFHYMLQDAGLDQISCVGTSVGDHRIFELECGLSVADAELHDKDLIQKTSLEVVYQHYYGIASPPLLPTGSSSCSSGGGGGGT